MSEPFHFSPSRLTLADGMQVSMRCIAPTDEPSLIDFHHALSDRSVHFRYFGMPSLGFRTTHGRLAALCSTDPDREIAVVAVEMGAEGEPRLQGIGRLIKTPGADEAEFALVVADSRQGKGLGTALLEALVALGAKAGVRLIGHILPGNVAMLHASRHAGFELQFSAVDQQWEARLAPTLEETARSLPTSPAASQTRSPISIATDCPMNTFDLTAHGPRSENVARNLSPARLYEEAIRHDRGSAISDTGALIVSSGRKTGRSPADKRIVCREGTKDEVWWGPVNVALDEQTYFINRERARDYLSTCERLYVVDGFAGWDTAQRLKVRVICSRPYHALFMHTMMIRPTAEELAAFGDPDFVIYNAGPFPANRLTKGMTSATSVDLSIEDRELVILGTEYAGEMKKGIFTIMHYLAPKRGHLSMHCSATAAPGSDRSSVLFGLSGTGKTTLSADPKRQLIGDDEHVWTDDGIYNIEGGCYAKTVDLTPESEPEIFRALHFGAVLENVVYDRESRRVDFRDTSLTQNTRGAYPIEFIRNARLPCVAGHPTDIIFLTCDAFGVLPPVAKLDTAQAMYHFISGYTAKVAGTEMGVTEPQAAFSACFGAPFLVWPPAKYAELLAEKMQRHQVNVWLVNTGWSGGSYGTGARIKLRFTRAIIDAIHAGTLVSAPTRRDPIFGFEVVTACPDVPAGVLWPESRWAEAGAWRAAAQKLAEMFRVNFAKVAGGVTANLRVGGPLD